MYSLKNYFYLRGKEKVTDSHNRELASAGSPQMLTRHLMGVKVGSQEFNLGLPNQCSIIMAFQEPGVRIQNGNQIQAPKYRAPLS